MQAPGKAYHQPSLNLSIRPQLTCIRPGILGLYTRVCKQFFLMTPIVLCTTQSKNIRIIL